MSALNVLVLAGGPDREREVSLVSGRSVAEALRQAGHHVRESDILPDQLQALDQFAAWPGDVIFPVLHGSWGEGGGLQAILEQRGHAYVGCRAAAARLCMDKAAAKAAFARHGLPTPPAEIVEAGRPHRLRAPAVLKAIAEGSSIDLVVCRDDAQIDQARADLHQRHARLLLEQFVEGKELTVGVIGRDPIHSAVSDSRAFAGPMEALPPIHIVPATEFYDYQAKYHRDDTQYLFDIDLPAPVLAEGQRVALAAAVGLGCRHLCRVDLIVDAGGRPWLLEINTIPGFTSHSLLPKAAAHAGIPMPRLVDRMVRLARQDVQHSA